MAEKKAFVTGHPIAHSRSPKIHGYWLNKYGIDGSYQAIDVAPADFTDFLKSLGENGYRGGNVTIPH
ncbi:MAG: shikimate dehydrogenase, partial [Mesorhizobium sp.]